MDIQLTRSVKSIIALFFYLVGINALYKVIKFFDKKGKVKILCFHDISTGYPDIFSVVENPHIFTCQINYLAKKNAIVNLSEATKLLEKKAKLRHDVFAITLDDCYKSFLTQVLPICKNYQVPFTVFLNTAPLDTRKLLPYDSLRLLAIKTTKTQVDLRPFGLEMYMLETLQQRFNFMNSVMNYLKQKSVSEQERIIGVLSEELEVQISPEEIENFLLSWADVITLSSNKDVTIGAHTEHHSQLSTLSEEDCFKEILNSKKRLECILNSKVRFFSYPYGDSLSYNDKSALLVKKAGFTNGYTLEWHSIKEINKFMLPRISINSGSCLNGRGRFSKALFAVEMSGLGDWIFGRKFM